MRRGFDAPAGALLASIGLLWVNLLTTARWADVPGALHGPKFGWFAATLALTTVVILVGRGTPVTESHRVPLIVASAGLAMLAGSLFVWFPPETWSQIPFLDNWPARYQSTVDTMGLYGHGVAAGWQWHFLGGYHLSSDLTVNLSALGWLPMSLFGPAFGFHVLHAVLLLSLPALVWLDGRLDGEDRDGPRLAAGLVALTVTGWFSYYLLRSGDTNSLAGTVCTLAAVTGSHAAARGRRWGAVLLVVSLVLVNYSHAGFFVYAALLLGVESLVYRDRGRARRAAIAIVTGLLTSLPLTWESWRFGDYFTLNNVALVPPQFATGAFLRKLYYNVEILAMPWRWFNDFAGLANVLIPILLFTAISGLRSRAPVSRFVFHAWAALVAIALMRLNTPEFGYAFLRPVHLLAVFPAAALAGFLVLHIRRPLAIGSTVLMAAVYLQYLWVPVPHVPEPRAADPELIEYIRPLDGAMVLFENTFHRDMDADSARESQPTPFGAHLEGLLVPATGTRFYAGVWDGWQWSPFRDQLLAGGAFRGRAIDDVPAAEVVAELRRWGVKHLLVWSDATTRYLSAHDAFVQRWQHGLWTAFELTTPDTRSVVTASGFGTLGELTPLGGTIRLDGVGPGDEVIVRTNYYPAWTAIADGLDVPVYDRDGQLAFAAPCDGTCVVSLVYPRRTMLTALAFLALGLGLVAATARLKPRPTSV